MSEQDVTPDPVDSPQMTEDEFLASMESGAESHIQELDSGRAAEAEETLREGLEGTEFAEEDTPAEDTSVDPDDLESALKALRRDGYTDGEIDALGQEAVVRLGLKRAKTQKDVDRAYEDLKSLKEQAEPKPTADKAEPSADKPSVDLKKLAKPLYQDFGNDAGDAIVGLVSKANEQSTGQLKQVTAELQATREFATAVAAETMRAGLGERFPQVNDDASWSQVLEKANDFAAAYGSKDGSKPMAAFRECVTDAAKVLFAGEQASPATSKKKARPSVPGKNPKPRAIPQEQVDDLILAALESGNKETAERLSRKYYS